MPRTGRVDHEPRGQINFGSSDTHDSAGSEARLEDAARLENVGAKLRGALEQKDVEVRPPGLKAPPGAIGVPPIGLESPGRGRAHPDSLVAHKAGTNDRLEDAEAREHGFDARVKRLADSVAREGVPLADHDPQTCFGAGNSCARPTRAGADYCYIGS
jgi:hypothetical protein